MIMVGIGLILYTALTFDSNRYAPNMPALANLVQLETYKETTPEDFLNLIYAESLQRYASSSGMIKSRPGGTVSESQAYGLIMAVGMDDKVTFDQIWNWTESSLQRKTGTFSWIWIDGKVIDQNVATDADQDIAYALILAYEKWGDERYRTSALHVLQGMWTELTKVTGGIRYVTAGNWTSSDPGGAVINPSYLSPYLYSVFAEFDSRYDWESLIESSYIALNKCRGAAGLPQDWCKIKNDNLTSKDYVTMRKSGDFAWEAMRIPYRIAQQHVVAPYTDTLTILNPIVTILERDWRLHNKLFATYASSGIPSANFEHYAMYGSALAAFCVLRPEEANELYKLKIVTTNLKTLDFYQLAWLWFGVDFYKNHCK